MRRGVQNEGPYYNLTFSPFLKESCDLLQENGSRHDACFIDYMDDENKRLGRVVDDHQEYLMKNAAGQIYIGEYII